MSLCQATDVSPVSKPHSKEIYHNLPAANAEYAYLVSSIWLACKLKNECRYVQKIGMQMSKCSACGYSPRTPLTRMRVATRRTSSSVLDTNRMVAGEVNFVRQEIEPSAAPVSFTESNEVYLKTYWTYALDIS